MVYIHSWQDYQDAAEALYAKSPNNTRYCVKWRSSEGKLVLKITDNTTCIKFKTYSSIFLNRFEALNYSLMRKMQNKQEPTHAPENLIPDDAGRNSPAPSAPITPAGTPASAGVAKKKKPKKKK